MSDILPHLSTLNPSRISITSSKRRIFQWLSDPTFPISKPFSPSDLSCGRIGPTTEVESPARKRKRQPLMEVPDNALRQQGNRTPSPSKRPRLSAFEDDETPRPSHVAVSHTSSSSKRSSKASSSMRSHSPIKQLAALSVAVQPVIFRPFPKGRDDAYLGAELSMMYRRIRASYSRGDGVISDIHKAQVQELDVEGFINDTSFTPATALPGSSPTPQVCAKIVRLAESCQENMHPEADWNCRVHSFLLDLALDGPEFRNDIGFINCSPARIFPPTLGTFCFNESNIGSKMVDFAIILEPHGTLKERIFRRAQSTPFVLSSINHTDHASLRSRPIGVSIETKLEGGSWNEAQVQIGTWVSAHFKMLERLMAEARDGSAGSMTGGKQQTRHAVESPPPLPVIIVQGHEWHLLVATREPTPSTVIYERVTFGTTSTIVGVYQIIVTLQCIGGWLRDFYQLWFERNCFPTVDDEAEVGEGEMERESEFDVFEDADVI